MTYAAVQENSKFSGLRAPATTILAARGRRAEGAKADDLFVCWAAARIAARGPFSSIPDAAHWNCCRGVRLQPDHTSLELEVLRFQVERGAVSPVPTPSRVDNLNAYLKVDAPRRKPRHL